MSRMPQPQNANRPPIGTNSEAKLSQTTAEPVSLVSPVEQNAAQLEAKSAESIDQEIAIATDKEATETAARFSLEVSSFAEQVAEQTAKAFEETANRIDSSGARSAIDLAAEISGRVGRELAGDSELGRLIGTKLGEELSKQLPGLVTAQADRVRQVARALRSAAS